MDQAWHQKIRLTRCWTAISTWLLAHGNKNQQSLFLSSKEACLKVDRCMGGKEELWDAAVKVPYYQEWNPIHGICLSKSKACHHVAVLQVN